MIENRSCVSCDSPLDVRCMFWHHSHSQRRGGQAMKVERFSRELGRGEISLKSRGKQTSNTASQGVQGRRR